jgi:cellulose synthase/poly-beta-1,6-N-acetylglucosamine synthase-like glycosyltransferase
MRTTVLVLTSGTRDRLILIEGLLKSLARQSVKPDEVLMATETNIGELIKMANKYLDDVNLRTIETGYWNKCWTANRAILESKGNVIFLLEDDLYLTPNFIEEVLNAFKEYPRAGCIYTRCIWIFRGG